MASNLPLLRQNPMAFRGCIEIAGMTSQRLVNQIRRGHF